MHVSSRLHSAKMTYRAIEISNAARGVTAWLLPFIDVPIDIISLRMYPDP